MSSIKYLLAASVLTIAAGSAFAQTLEARKMYAREEAEMATKVAFTNNKCGFDLKTKVDWPTFNAEEILQKSVAAWCAAALDAMEDLCSDALGKQAVTEKIKSLTCAGASEPAAKLADGNLTFSFSLTPNQNKLLVRTYLEKNL